MVSPSANADHAVALVRLEDLGVDFCARLREERRFSSIEALAAQIHADIAEARKVLAAET